MRPHLKLMPDTTTRNEPSAEAPPTLASLLTASTGEFAGRLGRARRELRRRRDRRRRRRPDAARGSQQGLRDGGAQRDPTSSIWSTDPFQPDRAHAMVGLVVTADRQGRAVTMPVPTRSQNGMVLFPCHRQDARRQEAAALWYARCPRSIPGAVAQRGRGQGSREARHRQGVR